MEIKDAQGHTLEEVTIRLGPSEVADLMVGASSLDDGNADHAVIRDEDGHSLALYLGEPGDETPIDRQSDWWVGPIILAVAVFVIAGAYYLASSLVHLLLR
ncbi:MAG: hypothetical protein ACRDJU_13070 [Actinomycetota bacterium]